MRAELNHGVRGFMIDTVYGQPASNGTVRTSLELVDIGSLDGAARGAAEAVQARQGADLGGKPSTCVTASARSAHSTRRSRR